MGRDQQSTPRSVLKRVAGWTLGNTLGRGGFGHVRKATHPLGRICAVKILPAVKTGEPMSKDQLLDAIEAEKEIVMLKVFGGLGMTGVVGLDLVKEDHDWRYLFLPMLPSSGSNLRYPMAEADLVPLMRGLLSNLHAMHSVGFCHEDIKPANILLDGKKTPVWADFGFSTFASQGQKVRSGGGTTEYMSPEKLEDYYYRGPPSDVYSCGILLCKWLTEHNPFIHNKGVDTDEQIEERILNGDAKWARDDVPGTAGELMRKMLAVNPKERWTIPEILAHPFLNPPSSSATKIRPVVPQFCDDPVLKPVDHILKDIVFLAYIAQEWYPGMTDKSILRHLRDTNPRWEKRMYHALAAWRPKDPDTVGTPSPKKDLSVKPKMKSLARILSETRLDGNVPKSSNSTAGYDQPLRSASVPSIFVLPTTAPRVEPTAAPNAPAKTSINPDKENTQTKSSVVSAPAPVIKIVDVLRPQDAQKIAAEDALKTASVKAKCDATAKSAAPSVDDIIEVSSDSESEEEDAEFLPAPMPKAMLRRSPRLAGKQPEMDAMSFRRGRRLRA